MLANCGPDCEVTDLINGALCVVEGIIDAFPLELILSVGLALVDELNETVGKGTRMDDGPRTGVGIDMMLADEMGEGVTGIGGETDIASVAVVDGNGYNVIGHCAGPPG